MTTIAPTYAYTDNAILSVNGHNLNLYSPTAGRGLYSESNGGLDAGNFAAAFRARDHHIWPEEAVRTRGEQSREPVDYWSEADAGPDVDDGNAREELINVAGCGLRFYVPYKSSVLWNIGFFVHVFRPFIGSKNDQEVSSYTHGDIRLQLSLSEAGGSYGKVAHTRRSLPVSVFIDNDPADPRVTLYEDWCSFYFDFHHMSRNINAGWHDIQLRLGLTEPGGGTQHNIKRVVPSDTNPAGRTQIWNHSIHNRVTFGVRNPTGLVLGGEIV